MQRRRIASVTSVAVLGILLLAGCSSFGTLDPQTGASPTPAASQSSTTDEPEDDATVELDASTSVPAGFPDDVPLIEGAVVYSADHPDNGPSVGYTVVKLH